MSQAEPVEHSYAAVYVLLMSWASDDLNVKTEVDELYSVFKDAYGYQVHRFLIPDTNSDKAVSTVIDEFTRFENSKTLLIVYYAGHGYQNQARQAIWAPSRKPNASKVGWYRHQPALEDSRSDVLLLLDCCHSIALGGDVREFTRKEVIAASGFDGIAPPVGKYSFTGALKEELLKAAKAPVSSATLHHRTVQHLQGISADHQGRHAVNPVWKLMGEGGVPDSSITLVSYSIHPLNLIAIMGATGAGKSSLINKICKEEVAEVGKELSSKTKELKSYNTVVNGQTVTLIDTPGFDDTVLTDTEILTRISAYLMEQYISGYQLSGLLYLRDITVDRMHGSALKNLDLFIQLVGADSMKNVALVTTKWDKVNVREAEAREKELKESYWAVMLGMTQTPPYRTASKQMLPAQIADPVDIIQPMLRYIPTVLQLQRELCEGKHLLETSAGKKINEQLTNRIEKSKTRLDQMKSTAMTTPQKHIRKLLDNQVDILKEDIIVAETDQKVLTDDFEAVMEAERQRRSRLFGYQTLERLSDYVSELEGRDHSFRALGVSLFSYGLYRACKHVWKGDGVSQEDLQHSKQRLKNIRIEVSEGDVTNDEQADPL